MKGTGRIGEFAAARIRSQRGVIFNSMLDSGDIIDADVEDGQGVKNVLVSFDSTHVKNIYNAMSLHPNKNSSVLEVRCAFIATPDSLGCDPGHLEEPSVLSLMFRSPDTDWDPRLLWGVQAEGSDQDWRISIFRIRPVVLHPDLYMDIEPGDVFKDAMGNIVAITGDNGGSVNFLSGPNSGYLTLEESKRFIREGQPEMNLPWMLL